MLQNNFISDEVLKKEIPIDLLTEEQREEVKKIGGGFMAVKYINEIIGVGLKTAKTYYDLYINP